MRFVPLAKSCSQAKQCVRAESLAAPHAGQKSVDIVMSILLPEKGVRLLFFSFFSPLGLTVKHNIDNNRRSSEQNKDGKYWENDPARSLRSY
jgi:hypothetical protein